MITYHIEKKLSENERALVLKAGPPFQLSKIPYSKTPETLKQLAAQGQLYLADKHLVIDLFAKTEFFYNVDDECRVSGKIKVKETIFDLRECDFICAGPPHWFVKGIVLKFITTEISWKSLQACLAGTATPETLEEGISVHYEGNSQAILAQQNQPTPLLKLTDRSGAFADLWMDYGKGKIVPFHEPQGEKRDKSAEKLWEKDLLETGFIHKNVGSSHYYCPMDQVAKSLAFLLEVGWQIRDFRDKKVVLQGQNLLQVNLEGSVLAVRGSVRFDDFEADLSKIAGAFNKRERFVELGPHHSGLLPDRLETLGIEDLLAEGELVGQAVHIPRNRIGTLFDLFEHKAHVEMDLATQKLKEHMVTFENIPEALPNSKFLGTLRPYQQLGVNWLSFLYDFGFHGLLADDMGLGKTVQVLAFLSRLEWINPSLVVLPTSLMFNWKREIERFIPTLSAEIHQGPLRARDPERLLQKNLVLTTYTTLRNDLELLKSISWHCVILDEAQAIKNGSTQTAQSVCKLNARFRLSITGTPLENRLEEVWSHFHFLMPPLFGDESHFQAQLQAADADLRYLKRIQKKMRPFVLRRKKEEVAQDLPEKVEQNVWIEMGSEQRRLYDQFLAGVRGNLLKKVAVEGVQSHRLEILEALLRLRQICCHPLLVSSLQEVPVAESSKLDTLLQDIETVVAEGRKALVYSQFTSFLKLLSRALTERGIRFAYLDGTTKDREEGVRRFQEDPELPLFLISLKAGGVGLNLTAADYVLLCDPWWNEAAENQAIDRAHRIGRKETVIAKRYLTVESVEEKMMTLKAHKRSLVDHLLEDGSAPTTLSAEDLDFLFS